MIRDYPLKWPQGQERTPDWRRRRAVFGDHTLFQCIEALDRELRLLAAEHLTARLFTNVPKGNPTRQDRVEANARALVLHIESLRGQERWGVGTVRQALRGYLVLPAPPAPPAWWEVLQVAATASLDDIEAAYHRLAREHHPDQHPDQHEAMVQLNAARTEARAARGAR